jgi:hypothetical protein
MAKGVPAVDLKGFTREEIDALAAVAFVAISDPKFPEVATGAAARLLGASRAGLTTVSKIPRDSLTALARFLQARITSLTLTHTDHPCLSDAIVKLHRRLQSKPGRPVADVWAQRKRDIRDATRKLRRDLGHAPTGADIAEALGVSDSTVRMWRKRRPDLFGAD